MNIERKDDNTPTEIIDLFNLPYKHFSNLLPNTYSLLDCACGNREQHQYLNFRKIFGVDLLDIDEDGTYLKWDLTKPFPFDDNSFDCSFSFETIEHLPEEYHIQFINELIRVTKYDVFVGSISSDGSDFINGIEIYKAKNGKNPHHKFEYSRSSWRNFFDDNFSNHEKSYYISIGDDIIADEDIITFYSNYIHIKK